MPMPAILDELDRALRNVQDTRRDLEAAANLLHTANPFDKQISRLKKAEASIERASQLLLAGTPDA